MFTGIIFIIRGSFQKSFKMNTNICDLGWKKASSCDHMSFACVIMSIEKLFTGNEVKFQITRRLHSQVKIVFKSIKSKPFSQKTTLSLFFFQKITNAEIGPCHAMRKIAQK